MKLELKLNRVIYWTGLVWTERVRDGEEKAEGKNWGRVAIVCCTAGALTTH